MSRRQKHGRGKADELAFARAEQRRCGKNEDGEGADAENPQNRIRLHQQRNGHRAIAYGIPREAGQNEAAQPFRNAESGAERRQSPDAIGPEGPRKRRRQAVENCEIGGHAKNGERQRPGKLIGLDQQGIAQPPEIGDEIAEAEKPAECEGGPQPTGDTAIGIAGRSVDQPDEQRERHEKRGENAERGKRQRTDGARKHGE
ncbi:hypothetical protein D3C71_647240 [compost metagenome]